MAMSVCRLCDAEVPRTSMLAHYSSQHPKERDQAYNNTISKRHEEDNPVNDPPLAKEKPKEPKGPPPTGIKEIADLRSRMVPLRLYSDTVYIDTAVVLFYDLTRLKDPL
ncbi:MAG: hypothetical protein HW384_1083 [Dehalococcoidia bacterium]|nr:hypothetical protein [Dehalococcoidia bacterium]